MTPKITTNNCDFFFVCVYEKKHRPVFPQRPTRVISIDCGAPFATLRKNKINAIASAQPVKAPTLRRCRKAIPSSRRISFLFNSRISFFSINSTSCAHKSPNLSDKSVSYTWLYVKYSRHFCLRKNKMRRKKAPHPWCLQHRMIVLPYSLAGLIFTAGPMEQAVTQLRIY